MKVNDCQPIHRYCDQHTGEAISGAPHRGRSPMLAATLARWPVAVPLPLFTSGDARESVRRPWHHLGAIGMARSAYAAAVATVVDAVDVVSIVPRAVGRAARRVFCVIAISAQLGGVVRDPPPPANAGGIVTMRLAGLENLIRSRRPAVPA
jgi:hypothetical protein